MLEMMLTESRDTCIAKTAPALATGRKWTPTAALLQPKSALMRWDVVGPVQSGRGGLVLERANHPGTRHLHQSDDLWWSRRFAEKSGLHVPQGQSHKESKDNGRSEEAEALLEGVVGHGSF